MRFPTHSARMSDFIVEALTRHNDRIAFIRDDGTEITYAEAAALTSRMMQILRQSGIQPGDGVGALGPNAPEMWLIQAATYLLAGRFTGLHALGSATDHAVLIDDAELSVLLVDSEYAERGAAAISKAGRSPRLLTVGAADHGEDIYALAQAIEPEPLDAGPARAEDIAWLQYTGGTTGVPKGVMLSQSALAQQTMSWLCSYGIPEYPRYLAAAPITHAAVLPLLGVLFRGGTVILQRTFSPETFLAAIERHRVNYIFAVPTMLYAVLDHPQLHNTDMSSLETVMYGAAPMSPAKLVELWAALGPVLAQGYASTESGGVMMSLRRHDHEGGLLDELKTSCGRPAAGVIAAILGPDNEPLAPGEVGEIGIRSATVMNGYWKQPELTEKVLAGGWLHTGDMGYVDHRGYYHIVDRSQDMIISGGFNIYPREVEDVLTIHPAVSAAAVIGVPHDRWGEQVTAYVVFKHGRSVPDSELMNLVRDRKGPHYAPKEIHSIQDLPTTAVGKIDKKSLRSQHWGNSKRQIN